jgi:hypothetical protein
MLKLNSYGRMTHYDPSLGADAVVYTGYTGQGAYWIRAPMASEGRKRREQKDQLLAKMAAAIDRGQPPGEVSIDEPLPVRIDETFEVEEY